MFGLSWLRHLPDVDYVPVPLVPEHHPATGAPIDMSFAILRSVSVMYSDYLKNMGVKSTMVMPLMKEGQLWGLISAMHHNAPRHVPYEARMAAEFLAHMLSLLMAAKENAEGYTQRLHMKAITDQLVEALCREPDLHKSLGNAQAVPNLLSQIPAHGAAVDRQGYGVTLMGLTPTADQVLALSAMAHQSQSTRVQHRSAFGNMGPRQRVQIGGQWRAGSPPFLARHRLRALVPPRACRGRKLGG